MEASKRSKQYCETCKKVTMHTPKMGLAPKGLRICEECRTINKVLKTNDDTERKSGRVSCK